MHRTLISLSGAELALVFVIVVAVLGLASLDNPQPLGALSYHTDYSTGVTACDLAGMPNGTSVTKYAAMQIYMQSHQYCYHVTGPEDWFCCIPASDHWTSSIRNNTGYQANFIYDK